MPARSCPRCGGPRPARGPCGFCGQGTRAPARGYRGLAGYRAMRERVLADSTRCHLCGDLGADEIDHVVPYADQDPATRDDPSTWRPEDFRPAHRRCNAARGRRPVGATR